MVMYCDPPSVQKPTIRAEEAVLTVSERRRNDNNAILDVHTQLRKVLLEDCVTSPLITYDRARIAFSCVLGGAYALVAFTSALSARIAGFCAIGESG